MSTSEKAIEPAQTLDLGRISGVPMGEYIADPGTSCSTVLAMTRSPAAANHRRLHPGPVTDARKVGSGTHCLGLEPYEYDARYTVAERCAATTKGGKACGNTGSVTLDGDWFCGVRGHAPDAAAPPLQTVLTPEQDQRVRDMVGGLNRHPLWHDLVKDAEAEVTLIYERDGIRCKARPDALVTPYCIDLKTTAMIETFQRQAIRYGYDVRAAWYLDACERCDVPVRDFLLAVLASDQPHEAYLWRVDGWWIDQGRMKLDALWNRYRECWESGVWAGGNAGIETMPIPDWAGEDIPLTVGGVPFSELMAEGGE